MLTAGAKQGYLQGTLDGGELTIDYYTIYPQHQGGGLGTQMIGATIDGADVSIGSIRATLANTNAEAFAATGDIWQTPLGKSASALGFTAVEQDGSFWIFTGRK